jgi:hypothetical protein
MQDLYLIKSGKFQKIVDDFDIKKEIIYIYDMFLAHSQTKKNELKLKIEVHTPKIVISDKRRFK